MAFPTILFNNGAGSDTAASGAGPATALSGTTNASFSGSVVTLPGGTDLSAVATDSSHVLYLLTSTGRKFFAITAKDNTAKTVTVANAPAGTSTARTWAIGGKRQTLAETNSRLLLSADALPGWIIELEDDQPAITSQLVCSASGSTTGLITLRGNSTSSRRLLTSATNNVSMLNGGLLNWKIENLKFESTASTKTTSYGIHFDANGASEFVIVKNCVFGHATNKLQKAINRDSTSQRALIMIGCEVQYCLSAGVGNSGGASSQGYHIIGCNIHHNSGIGIQIDFGGFADLVVEGCTIWANGDVAMYVQNNVSQALRICFRGNTVHGNTNGGLVIEHARNLLGAEIVNNHFTGNGAYGLIFNGSNGDQLAAMCDYNNYGTGGLANTTGARSGVSAGAHDLALDPSYTNASAGDFTIGTATAALGWPATIGQLP